jgi:CRISPR/Cas system CSM-associated protein Csm3 (group 7 of RAMP superfamily)
MIRLMTLHLVSVEPFAVTAPEIAAGTDLPVCTDPISGYLVMPGATVAGALRSHVARELGLDGAADWFGPDLGNGETPKVDRSSIVRVVGVLLHDEEQKPLARTEVFAAKQTAIDRNRNSAKALSLRDSIVVLPGARMTCFLRFDDPVDRCESDSRTRLMRNDSMPRFTSAVSSWSPVLGRAKTAGHGRMKLEAIKTGVLDLTTSDDRWRWVSLTGTTLFEEVCTDTVSVSAVPAKQFAETEFRIVDPLRLGGGEQKKNERCLPMRQKVVGNGEIDFAPYDGSSLKGLIRSRCEYITKSVQMANNDLENTESIDMLFGSVAQRGMLRFTDTAVQRHTRGLRPHVAIDRVSGGARDSALFVDEVFDDGLLNFRIEWMGNEPPPNWARELVETAFRDLDDALVGIGASSQRGYGTIKRTSTEPVAQMSSETINVLRYGATGVVDESTHEGRSERAEQ